jgi:hypothetical protein
MIGHSALERKVILDLTGDSSNHPMKITCPACKSLIPASQMNVATDVAVCEGCEETFTISSVLAAGQGIPEDFDRFNPPRGAWFDV